MKTKTCIIAALLLGGHLAFTACDNDEETFRPEWYRGSSAVTDDGTVNLRSLDDSKIDLIYLVSTEVLGATDDAGKTVYQSRLTAEDRVNIDGELAFAEQNFSQGDFNFLAPYYHQFTFEAIQLTDGEFRTTYANVSQEVNQIMDYYLTHLNQGRRFALVGFSQGAMLVADVLKHCSKADLRNMVGAYMLGYGLDSDDVQHPNILPATGPDGWGQTISFNSVMNREATWPFVLHQAVTTINPVNWCTDATPASFAFGPDSLSVVIDPEMHELIVTVPNATPYRDFMNANPAYRMAGVSADCLHRWDLLFYTQQIHDNILERGKMQKN